MLRVVLFGEEVLLAVLTLVRFDLEVHTLAMVDQG